MKQFFAICIVIASAMTVAFATKSFNYSNPAKDSIVEANIECLTDDEPGINGNCKLGEDYCYVACPNCQNLFYSSLHQNRYGTATNIHGICPVCKKEF